MVQAYPYSDLNPNPHLGLDPKLKVQGLDLDWGLGLTPIFLALWTLKPTLGLGFKVRVYTQIRVWFVPILWFRLDHYSDPSSKPQSRSKPQTPFQVYSLNPNLV